MDWSRYFFHSVASAGPILIACPVNNAVAIPRTFPLLQRSAIRSQGREIPRTIACYESIWRGMQRPGFRPNSGLQIVRSLHPMLCRGCDWRGGAEFCCSRLGFSLGCNPKERARTKGTESQEEGRRRVLPNVLPLPRKSSPKQDEPRAIRMGYVIEIEGTT